MLKTCTRLNKNKNNLNHLQHIILTSCVFYVHRFEMCTLGMSTPITSASWVQFKDQFNAVIMRYIGCFTLAA